MDYKRFLTYLGDKAAPGTIRVMLPYMLLNNLNEILANYDFVLHNTPSFYNNLNVLQFQRACTKQQLELIKRIKSFLPDNFDIFYDIDDWILDIPKYNHSYDYYQRNKNSILEILETVDVIVCSTSELLKRMSKYNKTKLIKNRLIRGLWETPLFEKQNKKTKIIWGGGSQHFSTQNNEGDFDNDILSFIEKTTEKYEWIFIGSLPLKLKNNKNIMFYPWRNYFDYANLMKKLNADIGIALLQNNNFNECKSNIKALEYTSLGIPGIYSNIAPYKNMSCKVNNTEQFINSIEKLAKNFDYRKDVKNADFKTLKDNLYWDDDYVKRYLNIYLGKN